jgi:hypothetical protein
MANGSMNGKNGGVSPAGKSVSPAGVKCKDRRAYDRLRYLARRQPKPRRITFRHIPFGMD